jgi:hypothetical protein
MIERMVNDLVKEKLENVLEAKNLEIIQLQRRLDAMLAENIPEGMYGTFE